MVLQSSARKVAHVGLRMFRAFHCIAANSDNFEVCAVSIVMML